MFKAENRRLRSGLTILSCSRKDFCRSNVTASSHLSHLSLISEYEPQMSYTGDVVRVFRNTMSQKHILDIY
jgi:hypothetical protein